MTFAATCVCFVLLNLKEKQSKTEGIVLKTEGKMRQKCAIKINLKYQISFSCTFETIAKREDGENENIFRYCHKTHML
jgi:hypothetical protein